MKEITKVSEITYQDVADYCRLDELTQDDINTINNLILIAKTFIKNHTGRTEEEIDSYQDFVIGTTALCTLTIQILIMWLILF